MKTNEIPANIGEYLKYDETSSTGLRWIKKSGYIINVGDAAGSKPKSNYYNTKFKGKHYLNHRIIFFLHNGYCPDILDHIDGNPLNNKIDNLREATYSNNNCNSKIQKNNKLGHKGISIKQNNGIVYYRVSITKNKKRYEKYFPLDKFQEACVYADELRKNLHGDFSNNGN